MLSASGVTFGYGRTALVEDLSFTVEAGGLLFVRGANGAGKSTLLDVIEGQHPFTRGELTWNGVSPLGQTQRSFQTPHYPSDMTVGALFRALGRPVPGALDKLQFQRFGALSFGQKKFVDNERVLHASQPILLLDEPEAGLAADRRAQLQSQVTQARARGAAVVWVAHETESDDEDVVELGAAPAADLDLQTQAGEGPTRLFVPKATAWGRPLPELSLKPHQLTWISGRNGSGKTSWTRRVAGLHGPLLGLRLDDLDLGSSKAAQRSAAGLCIYDADRPGFAALTVGEHLELLGLGAEARGAELERWRLRPDQPAQTLSGGERARLAWARVAASHSRVVWADEPFRYLDARTARQVADVLERRRAAGASILLLDHPEGPSRALGAPLLELDTLK